MRVDGAGRLTRDQGLRDQLALLENGAVIDRSIEDGYRTTLWQARFLTSAGIRPGARPSSS